MQNERNALKAGIFIIVSILLIIAVIVGIKGVGRLLEPTQDATVTFKLSEDIGGLSRGDEVRVGGAKVGVVRRVEFTPVGDGDQTISIDFSIPRRFVLHGNAVATVQSTVTGVSVLNFSSLGTGPALAAGESLTGRTGGLAALLQGNDLQGLVTDLRNVTVPKVNNAVDRAGDAIATYKETGQTATEFIKYLRSKIDPVIEKYYAVADTAKQALANIRDLFGDTKEDFRTTVANLSSATGTIKDRLPGMADKVDAVLTKVSTASESLNGVLEDAKAIVANTKDVSSTARSVIVTNRGKLESMIASLKNTGKNLESAGAEIRRSPWRLLYKPAPGEMANLNLYDSARQFADGAGQLSDAAIALRDAMKDPDVDQAKMQKLVDKLDETFSNFNKVEDTLWKQVKQ